MKLLKLLIDLMDCFKNLLFTFAAVIAGIYIANDSPDAFANYSADVIGASAFSLLILAFLFWLTVEAFDWWQKRNHVKLEADPID